MTAQWEAGEAGPLENVLVKSLTSWREQVPRVRFDVESTRLQIVQLSGTGGGNVLDGNPGFQRQISEELQLNAEAIDGQLEFVSGAFGFWEDGTDARTTWVLPPQPGTPGLNQITNAQVDISNWTWALYGQATYDLTDWASLTAGIRYTQDKKGLNFTQTDPRDGASPTRRASRAAASTAS
jgi:outer membrane receptor protein involved in Fe transport